MPKINLLNILPGDRQTILIDKINYNFDEILSAGGGPQGPQGIRGATGPIGPQGIQGPTGPQGLRGARWYVQPTAPAVLNLLNTPWGEPELGDYWMSGDSNSVPYGIYVYNDNGSGSLSWQYTGVSILKNEAFTAIDGINGADDRAIIHDSAYSNKFGLVLSDYNVNDPNTPSGYVYREPTKYGINSERAKLKITTDPQSVLSSLISFGRSNQDNANRADVNFSQNHNPRFRWVNPGAAGTDYNLELFNPAGDFNIKAPSNNFSVEATNANILASAEINATGNAIKLDRVGTGNIFRSTGSGSYYVDGSEIRFSPNYGSGNFIVGAAPSNAGGTKGLVISSLSSVAGNYLVFKAALGNPDTVYGGVVSEQQSGTSFNAGVLFRTSESSAADTAIDLRTKRGATVNTIRMDRDGNLQYRYGGGAKSLSVQDAASGAGTSLSVTAGASDQASTTGGTLYLRGGAGGVSSGKSGHVVINPGYVPSGNGGSVYLQTTKDGKINASGVAIGLAEDTTLGASLVVADANSGISSDILHLKKASQAATTADHFFGFNNSGFLTKGLPYTDATDITNYVSADVNNLDYYHEGSWISSLTLATRGTISGWSSSVYKIVKSNFTRIGNTVQVDFVIKIDGLSSVLTGAAPDTYLMIKGFPYEPDFTSTSFPVSNYATPSMPLVSLKAVGFGGSGGALGSIQVYPGQVAPSGWRICDGSSLSKNNYSGLYNALGGSSSPYGSDDGFASTFKLPDLRGLFVRGYGSNGTNPATSGAFAQYQSDELKSHTHTYQYPGNDSFTGSKFNSAKYDSPGIRTTTATGGDETRPKNIALNYIIYVGSSGSGSGDIAGAFVVDNSETRFYLYGGSGNISVTDLPVGGVVSYIHGSFSYFTNSVTKYLGTTPPPPPPGGGGGTPPGGGGGTPPPPPTRTTPAISNLEVVGQALVLSYSGVDSDASGLDVYTSTGNNYSFILAENVGGNTASGTRSYVIPQATTYFKIKTVYPDNTRSDDSNIEYYVYSAPAVTDRYGTITEQGSYLRIDLSYAADCEFTGTIYGTYTSIFGFGGGSFNAPFSINQGSTHATASVQNEYGSTIDFSSYYISDISTYQSSQCNGSIYLTLTGN